MHAPAFAAVTLITLAAGIGANTAIFSVIEGVLLKPLPYPHSEELIDVNHTAPGVNFYDAGAAPFLYFTYRDHARTFEDIGMWQEDAVSVTGLAQPERVDCLGVTDGTLPILGVQPVVGRSFSPKDDSPGSPETVMLTFGYWKAQFGGDASVIGRRMVVDGRAREIIGVLPRKFKFLDLKPVLIEPMQLDRNKTFLGNFRLSRSRQAEAWSHDSPGERRRCTLDSGRASQLSALPGLQRKNVRRGAAWSEFAAAQARSDRRSRACALGVDGNHRDGPADCLCKCGQPAAGESRRAATGTSDSCRAWRRLGTNRARIAARKRHARHIRRCAWAWNCIWRVAVAPRRRSGESSEARGDLD